MRKQIFDRIKKITCILLAVFFVVSLTAAAGAACTNNTTTPTTPTTSTTPSSTTDDKTLSISDLGALIASILSNLGYNLDLGNSGSTPASGDYSDLYNFLNNADTGAPGVTTTA